YRAGHPVTTGLPTAWRPGPRPFPGWSAPFPAWSPPPLQLPRQADRRFTIGRALACDLTLADLSVSRWHARLHQEDQQWLLSDLGSTNGTRLNGWRVTTGVPVSPGDQVSFGSLTFVITDGAAGSA
ncbi:MAG TPA: FHA domain-containing protein, partial [Streptosporangiaceae bacterium]